MMIRNAFFICLFLTVHIHALLAQKIDLDKRRFETEFADLPSDPTLSYFDTYSVDFFTEQSTIDQIGLSTATINSFFDLEGYMYSKEKAQFNYSISIDKPVAILEGVEEVQQIVKNPDGTTKVITQYVAMSMYSILTHISIKLIPYGTEMYASTFSSRANPTVFKSSPQATREAAQSIINYKFKGINSAALDVYRATLKTEVAKLKQKYCFHPFTSSSLLWEIDQKSAPELAPFNTEVNASIAILEKLNKNTPLTEARIKMASSLSYWSSKAASINATEKPLIKLKYACLYNSAVCQYYLELYDDCIESCQLLFSNGFNKSEGPILEEQAKNAKASIAKSGLSSRHQNRIGFTTTEHFEYTKIVIKKPTFIEQNIQSVKDFKKIGTSVADIGVGIYKDVTPPKITDTLKSTTTHFSYVRFNLNNELIELKGLELGTGAAIPNGNSIHENALYALCIFKRDVLFRKEGTVDGFIMNFRSNYKNSSSFNADSLIALIKKYQQDKLMDITSCARDTFPFWNNGNQIPSKIILGKDYPKKISVDAYISNHLNGDDGNQFYMTNNGDSFNLSIVDVVPVIVVSDDNGRLLPHAYLVTMKIPEIRLTKLSSGQLNVYLNDSVTLTNLEMRVLIY